MVEIRPTLPGDTWLVLADLREAEVTELAAFGVTSEENMRHGLSNSRAFTVFIGGQPAGMFGLMAGAGFQMPWGVFTNVIDRHPIPFLRATRRWVDGLSHLPCFNYVDARNVSAVKWFRWLGFDVKEPVVLGGAHFHEVRLH